MEIAAKDIKILKLKDEIRKNREKLTTEISNLNAIHDENGFLKEIKDDYKDYNRYIVEQKEMEKLTMEVLSKYLDKMIHDVDKTSEKGKMARLEQNRILLEIEKIKGELDKLTSQ